MKKFFIGVFLLVVFFSFLVVVKADELDDINNAINSLKRDLNSKEANYQDLNTRLNEIKNKLRKLLNLTNPEDSNKSVITFEINTD